MTIDHQIASLGKANLLGYFEHASAEWHEARKGVAGSLISSIMGHNPWRSAYTAYHEVLGLLDRESDGPSMAMNPIASNVFDTILDAINSLPDVTTKLGTSVMYCCEPVGLPPDDGLPAKRA